MPELQEKFRAERRKVKGGEVLFTTYQLEWQIQERLMGGVPRNEEVIRAWLEAKKPSEVAYTKRLDVGEVLATIDELAEEVKAEIIPIGDEEKAWIGFKQNGGGMYVDAYTVKAHLKDCANVLRRYIDVTALRSKLADRVYIAPSKIYLMRDGKAVTEPDGYWEHPVHVMTMQGPRSALKRTDYVDKPTLSFELQLLNDKIITREHLEMIMEYGATHGFGAERGMGQGQYVATWK